MAPAACDVPHWISTITFGLYAYTITFGVYAWSIYTLKIKNSPTESLKTERLSPSSIKNSPREWFKINVFYQTSLQFTLLDKVYFHLLFKQFDLLFRYFDKLLSKIHQDHIVRYIQIDEKHPDNFQGKSSLHRLFFVISNFNVEFTNRWLLSDQSKLLFCFSITSLTMHRSVLHSNQARISIQHSNWQLFFQLLHRNQGLVLDFIFNSISQWCIYTQSEGA